MKVQLFFFLILLISTSCNNDNKIQDNVISEQNLEVITIDTSVRTKQISKNSAGVVSCWLLDSDIERPRKTSFTNAMKDMGVKYIRFPYGHLADNYLWDADDDWGNTLTPKIASSSQAPANWDWAVNQSSGEFIKDMDFDEYISICNNVDAEPMVVVNILSYKYKNGPTYEKLKETAVEWVRYANITKGYNVKRWAIGNEVDHHSDLISQEEYKALYTDFATAMKKVDPDIWIGPGLLGNWHAAMLAHDPDNIDFICVHNYLYKYDWRNLGYEGWKNTSDILVNNVEECQNAVNNSLIPDTEIHVTEMNSRPWKDNSDSDDLFRALVYSEMVLNATSFEDVKATYVWNTHGPWNGPEENSPYNILDLDNNREPRGDVIKIINENILDYFVEVPRVNGFVRTYANVDELNENLNVFLINKNDTTETVYIKTSEFKLQPNYTIKTYSGNDPEDISPKYSEMAYDEINDQILKVELVPLSLNVVCLNMKDQ
jgi:alpha-L-arabinofuranosidase